LALHGLGGVGKTQIALEYVYRHALEYSAVFWIGAEAVESIVSGLLPYIYVERIDDTLKQVVAQGGEVVKAPYPEGNLWVATCRDPAGNVIGLWQEGPR